MYKVLLSDDEPLILAGLRHKIDWASLGFEIVGECTDGKALLDAVIAKRPDLLVLDIQMPHMTGLQVLQSIRNIIDIASIVISGYSDFAYAQDALRCGVIDYLLKPVSSQMLRGAVLKAKQHLDLSTTPGRTDASLQFHFLRMNIERMSEGDLLNLLTFSDSRTYYWIVAFHTGCALLPIPGDEVTMFRYDEHTMLAVIHCDQLPKDYGAFLRARFSFDGCAGVSSPFGSLKQLPEQADQAVVALETAWFKQGIYLWNAGNAEGSVQFFLQEIKRASGSSAKISQLLCSLPLYLMNHRLNADCAEEIYNALVSGAQNTTDGQMTRHDSWKEIRARYRTADDMLSALHHILVPDAEGDDSAASSRAIIFKVKDILNRDYAQPLSLQSMASRFHIDKSYLSSLFHEETGKTFTSYLAETRVRNACEYIRTTSLSNGKIAVLCGFANDSYMKKVFRKVLNITPTNYRIKVSAKSTSGETYPEGCDKEEFS